VDDFDATVWKWSVYKGKRHALPFDVHGYQFHYNAAAVREGRARPGQAAGDVEGVAGVDEQADGGGALRVDNAVGNAALSLMADIWKRAKHPLPSGARNGRWDLFGRRQIAGYGAACEPVGGPVTGGPRRSGRPAP
jgi:hypothetical protein